MKYCLFDTHAHYDHPLFDGAGPQIVRRLFDENTVDGIVIPAITYESNFHRDLFPEDTYPRVYFAAGLHPKCATNEAWWPKEKQAEFAELLADPRTVAVKTGLDFCKKALTDAQKAHQARFLRYLTGLAAERNLPLVLHVRDAEWEAVEILKEVELPAETVVHCYTYGREAAEAMMDAGVTRFGIGGMLTREEMDPLRECVRTLPLSKILIETDAPFVRPAGYEGAFNTSETMMAAVERIASLKGMAVEEVVAAVQENAHSFYGR